jgi:DNA mismatch repair protein MutS2
LDDHTLELLEWNVILDEIASSCFSETGGRLVYEQEILTEPAEVSKLLNLSLTARRLLESGATFPHVDFPDIDPFFTPLAKQGAVLDAEELARVGRFAGSAGRLKSYILEYAETDELRSLAEGIPNLDPLSRRISRLIDDDGSVKEREIPELKRIRSRIDSLQGDVNRLVSGYLTEPTYRSYWQHASATQRNGRTVLPLKANFRGRIRGIVHEFSASGATAYLEPADVVEKNNAIVEGQNEFRREVFRLLKELTAQVSDSLDDLKVQAQQIAHLDTLFARARYAGYHKCYPASYSPSEIRIIEGRHPLLEEAVPISVYLRGETRLLIITGPNTGGKTVTLKTVGLLSLMNQFGLEIPAAPGSSVEIYDGCFADIGDEQSIEQSLSTFSGHIGNLTRIVNRSTERSLVLMDELGAGTDPEEGVAIAMALLDHFIDKRCFTLATTHHGILKNYGYTRKGVQNASMEFNPETLTPTFRILMGVPGESHAIEVAEREGVPKEILATARTYLTDERSDISELIKRLSEKERELLAEEQSRRGKQFELEQKLRDVEREQDRIERRERELRTQGLRELRSFLEKSRRELDGLIKQIKEGELSREKTLKAREFLQAVRDRIGEEGSRLAISASEEVSDYEVVPGMAVSIRGSGGRGKVLRRAKGDSWLIETGDVRVTLGQQDFSPLAGEDRLEPRLEVETPGNTGDDTAFQLDVRGLRYAEALSSLEKQIDGAVLQGMKEFWVVHGTGEGVLGRAIHSYLKECSVVESYHFATPRQGGFGKTVVRLKGGG